MSEEMDGHFETVLAATMVPCIRKAMANLGGASRDFIPDDHDRVEFVSSIMLLIVAFMAHVQTEAEVINLITELGRKKRETRG